MKKTHKSFYWVLLNCLLAFNTSFAQDSAQQKEKVIISWLKENAFPIQYTEAGNGFADLQPFNEILKHVKVVGLGEATHGTREFFQFKHRLFEFLVRQMNFTAFALEASTASSEAINDYILNGKGDRATALTSQGYSPWDTEEFAALIDWMHSYNETAAEDKKVKFYGLDVAYNEPGRKQVLAYLHTYAPQYVDDANSIFAQLSVADEKWPMRINEFKDAAVLLPKLQELIKLLKNDKARLLSVSSPAEFEQTMRHAQIMEEMLMVVSDYPLRTKYMAKNLLYLMEKNPNDKFIVSAHNRHINVQDHIGDTNLGHVLQEAIGDQYYAILFDTYRGEYQSRAWIPEKRVVSNFLEVPLPAAPQGSLAWYFAQVKRGNLFLNLRDTVNNATVNDWLNSPQVVNDIQWIYQEDTTKRHLKLSVQHYYDGILFIENTTSSRPTKNAQEKAYREVGF